MARIFFALTLAIGLLAAVPSVASADSIPGVTLGSGGTEGYADRGSRGTFGWYFVAKQDTSVTSLGVWDSAGNGFTNGPHRVGLWNSSGMLLASADVGSGNYIEDGFRWADLGVGDYVELTAGAQYTVGALYGDYYNRDTMLHYMSINESAYIDFRGSAYHVAGNYGFSNPTNLGAGSYYFGPNIKVLEVAAVPEPGTLALLGLGMAGLGWHRRRSMRAS